MKRFSQYLNHALLMNECVIMPGFGGFVCHKEPAYIDELNGELIPTSKRVTFNSSLNYNDTLLAGLISKIERISLIDAIYRVELSINNIKTCLDRDKELYLEGIGTFTINAEGNIAFKSDNRNYLPTTAFIPAIQLPAPALHIKAIESKSEAPSINITKYIYKGVAAVAAVALIAGVVMFGIEESRVFKHNRSDKASFEPVYPFIPTTPQVNQCESVISPDCDYLDFISEL